jgi:undecaprenyl-diphosphatase
VAGPARFVHDRLTPGHLGLEVTTLLALTAVGGFTFFALGDLLDEGRRVLPGDVRAFDLARAMHVPAVERAVAVLTDVGSFPSSPRSRSRPRAGPC